MTPMIYRPKKPYCNHKIIEQDFDEMTKNYFIRVYSQFLIEDIQNNFSHFFQKKTFSNDEHILVKEMQYTTSIKLGVLYFHGYSFPWEFEFRLEEIKSALKGERLEKIPKSSLILKTFNDKKVDSEKFEKLLVKRGFEKCDEIREYNIKALINNDNIVNMRFDKDLNLMQLNQFVKLIFSIDYVRDRNNSSFTKDGTYLDIYDIRFLFNSSKILPIDEPIRKLIKSPVNNSIENLKLLEKSDGSENITTRVYFKYPIGHLRENSGVVYAKSLKKNDDLNPMDFIRYFSIRVETLTEYDEEKSKISNENHQNRKSKANEDYTTFKKISKSHSIVNCQFDINKWLIDLEKWFIISKVTNRKIENLSDIFYNLSDFIFDQIISLSNELSSLSKKSQ
jgi:hypothetical protein